MQQKQIRARKSLGQHFLRDGRAVQKIVAGLKLTPEDVVLEIGCGTGALTQQLVGKSRQYIGVELDTHLCHALEERFAEPQAVFINQDILALNLHQLQKEYLSGQKKFKVVGNLPYYISSPIIDRLAQHASMLELVVIMLQAEVADRLLALPGTKEYGILTLVGQYYFGCEELFSLNPQAFRPPPKVFSKVIRLVPKTLRSLAPHEEHRFFEFLKRSFSQRRKTLKNCLKEWQGLTEGRLEPLLEQLNYPEDVRAEKLSLEDFVRLYQGIGSPIGD